MRYCREKATILPLRRLHTFTWLSLYISILFGCPPLLQHIANAKHFLHSYQERIGIPKVQNSCPNLIRELAKRAHYSAARWVQVLYLWRNSYRCRYCMYSAYNCKLGEQCDKVMSNMYVHCTMYVHMY